MSNIKSFTDLIAWQKAHKLVVNIYKITERFPGNEQYGLVSQIKRSSVSITSNLAEGYSRKTTKDKSCFYLIAHGSLTECQSQLILSRDLGYIDNQEFHKLARQSIEVSKLINGLRVALKR